MSTMTLFDTRRQRLVEFRPHRPDHVSIYSCGATVHGPPHVGHLRSAVTVDVLRRWLAHSGHDVLHVRNVTDIDDKILTRSAAAGRPWWEWAAHHERAFTLAYDALGCLPPSLEPRATGHITQAVELIERLLASGHAYVDHAGSGDVLFEVARWHRYGELSHQQPDRVRPGTDAAASRRGPGDFTLWKKAKPGEPRWPSPWGHGRPSWHVECSAMSTTYLGPEFDLHTGGRDLVFPHHENERAQSMAAGDGFAGHWMHTGWVTAAGEKMSKSLGNALGVAEVLRRARSVEIRYYLLAPHYRSTVEYSDRALDEAARAYRRIEHFLHRARERAGASREDGDTTLPVGFRAALDDDLATPTALAVLHAVVREGQVALDRDDGAGVAAVQAQVTAMLRVLGLDASSTGASAAEPAAPTSRALRDSLGRLVESTLARRRRARDDADFALADSLRDELARAGVVVRDTATGTTTWTWSGRS